MYPIISFGSGIEIPSYLVYLSLLYCFLIWWTVRKAQKENKPLELILNLDLVIMISGFLGARLFHVFYENPTYYKEDLTRLLKIWEGGFVFYGGAIAAIIAGLIYVRSKSISPWEWLDFYAPVTALGYALGRIACVLAGCCYGNTCPYPWALQGRHPTQIYASLGEFMVLAVLTVLQKRNLKFGILFSAWLIGHGLNRLVMEFFRADFRGDLIVGLSVSTWISILFVATGASLLAVRIQSKSI